MAAARSWPRARPRTSPRSSVAIPASSWPRCWGGARARARRARKRRSDTGENFSSFGAADLSGPAEDRTCLNLLRSFAARGTVACSNPRQRPLRLDGRRHLHQRLAVEHDLVGDHTGANETGALAFGNELRDRHGHVDLVADPHRRAKIERLRYID